MPTRLQRSGASGRLWRTCLLASAGLLVASAAAAQPPLEYEVKAAFLLNFTKFVEWPASAFASAHSPIAICIIGRDPFGRTLDDMVQGEEVNGRRITVQRIASIPAPQTCQIVYIGAAERELERKAGRMGPGVLTVGEDDDFIAAGGMICFVIENRRVRFDINQTAAENASLRLSSKLLSVARLVEHLGRPAG